MPPLGSRKPQSAKSETLAVSYISCASACFVWACFALLWTQNVFIIHAHTTHVYTMRTYYVYTVHTHTHTSNQALPLHTLCIHHAFQAKYVACCWHFTCQLVWEKLQQLGHRKFMIQALHQAFISWCAYTKTCCRKSENLQEKQFLNNEQHKLITRYRSRFGLTKKEDAGIARLGNGGRSISPNSHLEWVSEIHKVQSCLLNVSKRQSISTIKCIPTILQPKHPRRLSGGSLCKVPANHASK